MIKFICSKTKIIVNFLIIIVILFDTNCKNHNSVKPENRSNIKIQFIDSLYLRNQKMLTVIDYYLKMIDKRDNSIFSRKEMIGIVSGQYDSGWADITFRSFFPGNRIEKTYLPIGSFNYKSYKFLIYSSIAQFNYSEKEIKKKSDSDVVEQTVLYEPLILNFKIKGDSIIINKHADRDPFMTEPSYNVKSRSDKYMKIKPPKVFKDKY